MVWSPENELNESKINFISWIFVCWRWLEILHRLFIANLNWWPSKNRDKKNVETQLNLWLVCWNNTIPTEMRFFISVGPVLPELNVCRIQSLFLLWMYLEFGAFVGIYCLSRIFFSDRLLMGMVKKQLSTNHCKYFPNQ